MRFQVWRSVASLVSVLQVIASSLGLFAPELAVKFEFLFLFYVGADFCWIAGPFSSNF